MKKKEEDKNNANVSDGIQRSPIITEVLKKKNLTFSSSRGENGNILENPVCETNTF